MPEGRKRRAEIAPVQVGMSHGGCCQLLREGKDGDGTLQNPSHSWPPFLGSDQGVTEERHCQPGAQATRGSLGAYLGFELFQKTM